jgi:hypothetical protein
LTGFPVSIGMGPHDQLGISVDRRCILPASGSLTEGPEVDSTGAIYSTDHNAGMYTMEFNK